MQRDAADLTYSTLFRDRVGGGSRLSAGDDRRLRRSVDYGGRAFSARESSSLFWEESESLEAKSSSAINDWRLRPGDAGGDDDATSTAAGARISAGAAAVSGSTTAGRSRQFVAEPVPQGRTAQGGRGREGGGSQFPMRAQPYRAGKNTITQPIPATTTAATATANAFAANNTPAAAGDELSRLPFGVGMTTSHGGELSSIGFPSPRAGYRRARSVSVDMAIPEERGGAGGPFALQTEAGVRSFRARGKLGLEQANDRFGAGGDAAFDWRRGGGRKLARPAGAAVGKRESASLSLTPELSLGQALRTVGGLMTGEGAKLSVVRCWRVSWG